MTGQVSLIEPLSADIPSGAAPAACASAHAPDFDLPPFPEMAQSAGMYPELQAPLRRSAPESAVKRFEDAYFSDAAMNAAARAAVAEGAMSGGVDEKALGKHDDVRIGVFQQRRLPASEAAIGRAGSTSQPQRPLGGRPTRGEATSPVNYADAPHADRPAVVLHDAPRTAPAQTAAIATHVDKPDVVLHDAPHIAPAQPDAIATHVDKPAVVLHDAPRTTPAQTAAIATHVDKPAVVLHDAPHIAPAQPDAIEVHTNSLILRNPEAAVKHFADAYTGDAAMDVDVRAVAPDSVVSADNETNAGKGDTLAHQNVLSGELHDDGRIGVFQQRRLPASEADIDKADSPSQPRQTRGGHPTRGEATSPVNYADAPHADRPDVVLHDAPRTTPAQPDAIATHVDRPDVVLHDAPRTTPAQTAAIATHVDKPAVVLHDALHIAPAQTAAIATHVDRPDVVLHDAPRTTPAQTAAIATHVDKSAVVLHDAPRTTPAQTDAIATHVDKPAGALHDAPRTVPAQTAAIATHVDRPDVVLHDASRTVPAQTDAIATHVDKPAVVLHDAPRTTPAQTDAIEVHTDSLILRNPEAAVKRFADAYTGDAAMDVDVRAVAPESAISANNETNAGKGDTLARQNILSGEQHDDGRIGVFQQRRLPASEAAIGRAGSPSQPRQPLGGRPTRGEATSPVNYADAPHADRPAVVLHDAPRTTPAQTAAIATHVDRPVVVLHDAPRTTPAQTDAIATHVDRPDVVLHDAPRTTSAQTDATATHVDRPDIILHGAPRTVPAQTDAIEVHTDSLILRNPEAAVKHFADAYTGDAAMDVDVRAVAPDSAISANNETNAGKGDTPARQNILSGELHDDGRIGVFQQRRLPASEVNIDKADSPSQPRRPRGDRPTRGEATSPVNYADAPHADRPAAALHAVPHTAPAQPGATVAHTDPLAAHAAQAAHAQTIVETVETVAAHILVSPALARGEGKITIQLKKNVLDGSEISVEVKRQTVSVAIFPATPDAAVAVERNRGQLETALAARMSANYHVTVSVKKGRNNENA